MKSLRKLRALPLLLALIALLALPALAADEYQDGDFKFTMSQARATITGYTGEGAEVVIPSQVSFNGKSYPVSGIKDAVFRYNKNVVSVTLPDTVTEIGSSAFSDCTNLVYLKLPKSLEEMPYSMCSNNPNLQTVVLPECNYSVGINAFSDCPNLTGVDLSRATKIGEFAFEDSPNAVVNLNLPVCTEVGGYAFRNCTALTTVALGNQMDSVFTSAFENCTNLVSLDLGDSVKWFGYLVFKNTGLVSVYVPDCITHLNTQVFEDCKSLQTVYFYAKNLSSNTFSGCTSLTEVILGENVEYIDSRAFDGASSLESITIPKNTRVYSDAFAGAPFLTTIYGYKNSSAEEYADKNGLVFIPLNEPEEQTISVSKNSFTMALKSTLSLKASSSSGIVDYQTSDPSVATVSSDGTVSAQGIGRAIITITAPETDEYQSASRLVEIIVCPKKNKIKSVSGNAKSVTVKWTKDTAAQGYLVQWCKKSSFKGAKSATISKNSTVSKVIKKPGKGKWYFRVGSYKTISGKKQYVWSKTVSKKLK